MHTKIVTPDSFDWNSSVDKTLEMIKMASAGIGPNDFRRFVKRAGSEVAHRFKKIDWGKGEIPIHLIALGATEGYSNNRNGDGFKEAALKKYHPTFVKLSMFYRGHKNKDRAKSYGVVRDSIYNPEMKRVELLIGLNGTKEAAEKNGGLLADKEMEKLANDKELGVSMSCRIDYDNCSWCDNKARNRGEYCKGIDEGGMCKAGGLKNRITRVLKNGHVLHADNRHPYFFDISHVDNPADRIAYAFGKMASVNHVMSGSELAEAMGVTTPMHVIYNSAIPGSDKLKSLYLLKVAEDAYGVDDDYDRAFDHNVQGWIEEDIDLRTRSGREKVGSLHAQNICLPLKDFIRFQYGFDKNKSLSLCKAASVYVKDVFNRLSCEEDIESVLEDSTYNNISNDYFSKEASIYEPKFSLSSQYLQKRVLRSLVRSPKLEFFKEADFKPIPEHAKALSTIARDYGLYKVAFLNNLYNYNPRNINLELTTKLLVRQNCII